MRRVKKFAVAFVFVQFAFVVLIATCTTLVAEHVMTHTVTKIHECDSLGHCTTRITEK